MDTRRVKTGHPKGATPPNVYSDFEWVKQHEKELLEKYGECSLIVYKEQVIGFGDSYEAALDDAEQHLPPDASEITPIHAMIYYPTPFFNLILRHSESE